MKRVLVCAPLAAFFAATLFVAEAGAPAAPASDACPRIAAGARELHPPMRPDPATRRRWIESYRGAPRARAGDARQAKRGSVNLLPYLQYTPAERDQGYCGDCWAWAGTGVIEIALNVQEGIRDRLSVQYLNSCYDDSYACCGGWLEDVASFYADTRRAVAWANPNASWQDGNRSCSDGVSLVRCCEISTAPASYGIGSIALETIETQGAEQATAIANVKAVLDEGRAVWFAFFMSAGADWNTFRTFWRDQPESALFDFDSTCGKPWDSGGGGHAVLCVGYNDDDPGNRYWIMLNSWGDTTLRPNGLFRVSMDLNYDCADNSGDYNLYFQTLAISFSPSPTPVPTCTPSPPTPTPLFICNVGTVTGDNQCVGVEFDGSAYWISAGGKGADPNKLYKIDPSCRFVAAYDQPSHSTGWGWRDLAWDGTYLYGSSDANIDQVDPSTGQWTGTSIPGPLNPNRALAYDPATGHFWTADWSSDIYEIARDGAVVNAYPNGLYVYGMAWDDVSPDGPWLWTYSQDGTPETLVSQFDPRSGSYTGVEFCGVYDTMDAIAGGACFARMDSKAVFIGLTQGGDGDFVFGRAVAELATPTPVPTLPPVATPTPTPVPDPNPGGVVICLNGCRFRAGDPLDVSVSVTTPIWARFDAYLIAQSPAGTYSVLLDGRIVPGIVPFARGVPRINPPFLLEMLKGLRCPSSIRGETPLYLVTTYAGTMPAVSRLEELSVNTHYVLTVDNKQFTVE